MNILTFPELFCLISTNLNDKEKIFLTSCSKIMHNFKSLVILNSEYSLEEIDDRWHAKNIFIKDFSSENKIKKLIKDLIPESIIVNSKRIKFISNNTNIKLFHNEEIIFQLISYEYSLYLTMKILLNDDGPQKLKQLFIPLHESANSINKQFPKAPHYDYPFIVKLLIDLGVDIPVNDNEAIITVSWWIFRYGKIY